MQGDQPILLVPCPQCPRPPARGVSQRGDACENVGYQSVHVTCTIAARLAARPIYLQDPRRVQQPPPSPPTRSCERWVNVCYEEIEVPYCNPQRIGSDVMPQQQ